MRHIGVHSGFPAEAVAHKPEQYVKHAAAIGTHDHGGTKDNLSRLRCLRRVE